MAIRQSVRIATYWLGLPFPHKRGDGGVYPADRSIFSPVLDFAVPNIPIGNGAVHLSKEVPGVVAGVEDAMILADQIVPGIFTDGAEFFVDLSNRALYFGNRDNGVLIESEFLIGKLFERSLARSEAFSTPRRPSRSPQFPFPAGGFGRAAKRASGPMGSASPRSIPKSPP